MRMALITGSAGLVGSAAVRFFTAQGFGVIGIDNDLRQYFFGAEGSTGATLSDLKSESGKRFINHTADIRDYAAIEKIIKEYAADIAVVIHAAGQPSHEWASRDPLTDFGVNALGTLNLLEAVRKHCPQAVFIFVSTNKVYGDWCNHLPLVEQETRWELNSSHSYYARGIDEGMSLDQCTHSLFGASKAAADIMVQEYGRYFGMNTGVFRAGCISGPCHAGVEQHGYLAYLMKCAVTGREYQIFGYKGKQVRDNLHCHDLVKAFYHFYQNPKPGEVYNIGGGRLSHSSLLESITLCEKITGRSMKCAWDEANRCGDHIWWVSDASKFLSHYPSWALTRNTEDILTELYEHNRARWASEG